MSDFRKSPNINNFQFDSKWYCCDGKETISSQIFQIIGSGPSAPRVFVVGFQEGVNDPALFVGDVDGGQGELGIQDRTLSGPASFVIIELLGETPHCC